MNLHQIYELFPTKESCVEYLETIRWNGFPTCPYCQSANSTSMVNEHRYHCNTCNTSYSVTVQTIFHKTRLDLQKWFFAISLIDNNGKFEVSGRQLARILDVNKDTASFMIERIYRDLFEERKFLTSIVDGLTKASDSGGVKI